MRLGTRDGIRLHLTFCCNHGSCEDCGARPQRHCSCLPPQGDFDARTLSAAGAGGGEGLRSVLNAFISVRSHFRNFPNRLRPLPCYFFLIYLFFDRGKEKEREKHQCVLPLVCPLLGTWPATQACALTGNRTGNPLVPRLVLNALSYTSQGIFLSL